MTASRGLILPLKGYYNTALEKADANQLMADTTTNEKMIPPWDFERADITLMRTDIILVSTDTTLERADTTLERADTTLERADTILNLRTDTTLERADITR